MRPMKVRLGELLVDRGFLTAEELPFFLAKAKQTGKKLGRVLVDANRISDDEIVKVLANQLGFEFIDLTQRTIVADFALSLTETVARRLSCLVVDKKFDQANRASYTVAMSDPADVFAYDEINKILDGEIDIVAATEQSIFNAIDRIYRKTEEIDELAEELTREFAEYEADALDFVALGAGAGTDAPVVKLLQSIFEDAIGRRASDIHIEPMDRKLVVRIRVDGTLHVLSESDPKTAAPLAQRLKLISGLNISERRIPQDGRFNVKVHRHVIDVRIATSPTAFGESVVMRLLNQNATHLNLDQLGMPPATHAAFVDALEKPQGMILVTGPTGSGKTTTLYSALTRLNSTESKLITVEDPIEYRISGINQIQAHEKIGLTFHTVLRSILRQDPDVILVGEMRDRDTVEAALRASMTGHLVLSTLHTNDAKSATSRLIDMGAEPFVVGQSLQMVVAQRLVRMVCPHCARQAEPTPQELAWSERFLDPAHQDGPVRFMQGKGCDQCSHTGYLGRSAVYEHLCLTKELIAALDHGSQRFSEVATTVMSGRTLAHHANRLARQGRVTVREARRVSYEV
jgi:MSHA biogenesis protein MshE